MSDFNRCTVLVLICILPILTYGQKTKLKQANKEYEQLGFIRASEVYEDVASKGYRSVELLQKLGNTYYFNANYEKAASWYKELFALDSSPASEYHRRYAQSLKAIGEDVASQRIFETYLNQSKNGSKTDLSVSDYLNMIEENSGRYSIRNLPFNTPGIDFGGSINDGKLLFASTRDTGTVSKRRSAWDELSFLDIFEVNMDSEESYGPITKVKGEVNTRFHESSAWVTKDGNTMYFTRNNTNPEHKKDKPIIQYLKIYRASLVNGKWTNVESLLINGDHYSTAHPVLNSKEDRLYFVSDRPESVGATDIFYAEIKEDGSLGQVSNAGKAINTTGRESFPFITDRDELYFSSDGHFGLGGYDVFYIQLSDDDNFSKRNLLNVGKPINSAMDDIAFSINTDTGKGFVSSNRKGGMGYDDIYSFTEIKPIKDLLKAQIKGRVTDERTREVLAKSEVSLFYEDGSLYKTVMTDAYGDYQVSIHKNVIYAIRATKEGYNTQETNILKGQSNQVVNFELERDLYALAPGGDLAKTLGIKEIYFDFNKSIIRSDAEVELQKVIVVMQKYPKLTVAIRAHTDSRGNDLYNLNLSDKRAKSTKQYLIDNGITKERLTAKGIGEFELVNRCSNEIKCNAAEHEQNRRSEFIIDVQNK